MKKLVALIGVSLLPCLAYAQSPTATKVDQFLAPFVQMHDFSGCVLVAKHDAILKRGCYGDANYELTVAHTPESRFHIASISKTFTAAAIVLLQKQGKLQLTDKLSQYIPGFPDGDKITIQNLLQHSSGLPDFESIPEYATLKTRSVSLEELIAIMRNKPLDFPPGTKSSYSNTGYAFLAYVIEKVSGQSYEQFLQHEIFTPLGMKGTGTFSDTALIPHRASGYQPWLSKPGDPGLRNVPFYDKTILIGSGSLYSTIDDLYLWYKALRDKKLFDAKANPFGWGPRTFAGKKFLEQNGRDPGYVSRVAAFLDDDVVVIVLSNLEIGADDAIAKGLETIVFGADATPPPIRPSITVRADTLKAYEGRYEVGPNFDMDIKVIDGHLFLRGTGGDYLPLDSTAVDTFFYKQLYVSLVFHHDSTGHVDSLLWDAKYPCKKIAEQPAP